MAKHTRRYKFRVGDRFTLDQIDHIQGLGRGDWWEKTGEDVSSSDPYGMDFSEFLICTKNITITIIIERDDP